MTKFPGAKSKTKQIKNMSRMLKDVDIQHPSNHRLRIREEQKVKETTFYTERKFYELKETKNKQKQK